MIYHQAIRCWCLLLILEKENKKGIAYNSYSVILQFNFENQHTAL